MTERVLDVLKRHNIKATFFLIGEKVEKFPHIVKRIVEEGHIVANHTYSHSGLFPLSSSAKVKEELQRCNDSIYNAVGLRIKLFRPPFGVTNPIIGKMVKRSDYKTIGWSIRSLDTINDKSRNDVADKVIGKLHRGAIILLHDRCNDADVLLETIIASAIEKKYTFVPLDELLKIDAYEN
jgi:peptidoglycan/xylan/chitin deacetylase (PgdA/CDA1 family)